MDKMKEIEKLASAYASERAVLGGRVTALDEELRAATKQHMPNIRRAVAACKAAEDRLREALEENPQLFKKPRSQTFHGIKVGYQKAGDKLDWENDEHVLKLIKTKLPEELHAVLITTVETLSEQALENLNEVQLKKIGVQVVVGEDHVVLKAVDGNVEKLVKALLKDHEEEAAEAKREAA